MGGKQARKRKFLLFYIAFCMTLMTSGACQHLLIPQKSDTMERVNTFISERNFGAALDEIEKLDGGPQNRAAEALYLKGIIYAHPENPNRDEQRSFQSFQTLIERYPSSDQARQAAAWISLFQKNQEAKDEILQLKETIRKQQDELEGLKTQLDELKKIDLGTADKKRGATTP